MWPKQGDIGIDLKSGRDIEDRELNAELGMRNAETRGTEDG